MEDIDDCVYTLNECTDVKSELTLNGCINILYNEGFIEINDYKCHKIYYDSVWIVTAMKELECDYDTGKIVIKDR